MCEGANSEPPGRENPPFFFFFCLLGSSLQVLSAGLILSPPAASAPSFLREAGGDQNGCWRLRHPSEGNCSTSWPGEQRWRPSRWLVPQRPPPLRLKKNTTQLKSRQGREVYRASLFLDQGQFLGWGLCVCLFGTPWHYLLGWWDMGWVHFFHADTTVSCWAGQMSA